MATLLLAILAFVEKRQLMIRYHIWKSATDYEHVLADGATQAQREQYRKLAIHHFDKLVELGHWSRTQFTLISMEDPNVFSNFFMKALTSFPKDTSYFYCWGPKTNTSIAYLDLWAQIDYIPKWQEFLDKNGFLIKK